MGGTLRWHLSHRADQRGRVVADRHYNRQKVGSPQFVPPGRCLVLAHPGGGDCSALWVSSWPFAEYVKHAWAGAWINSCFRKECEGDASEFIREAIAATRWKWAETPDLGMVTFIDPSEVTPRKIRGRSTWGHSYFEAGFKHVGYTKAGLWAMQMLPHEMPEPCQPHAMKEVAA
jgi:hypothetical protein